MSSDSRLSVRYGTKEVYLVMEESYVVARNCFVERTVDWGRHRRAKCLGQGRLRINTREETSDCGGAKYRRLKS